MQGTGDKPGASGEALLVVIDGPAGAGKTTVAQALASHFGLPLLDTGAIYRSLALLARRRAVGWDDGESLAKLASTLPIRFVPADPKQRVMLDGEDVSDAIRTPEVSQGASIVSAHPPVRAALLELQRALGAQGCVAEGRDLGTVVFPDAAHKFFITATAGERARRRHADLASRGAQPLPTIEQVADDMAQRDERDSQRAAAPLTKADDAVELDTSDMGIEQVVASIVARVTASTSRG